MGMNDLKSEFMVDKQPFYEPILDEVELFEAAYDVRVPLMLKGPTGCGKSRFVEYMAHRLGKPLVTVVWNEDMTASDLVGRYLIDEKGTRWQDGPLTLAAKMGAICYLDEIVEARQDTIVVIHPLTDHRRVLPLEKKGELLKVHEDFQLVISYNPGYQSVMKDLKQSTKQRFSCLKFNYPVPDIETEVLCKETGIEPDKARNLVEIAKCSRNLIGHGLEEGMSTRLLVFAAQLINQGVEPVNACKMALIRPITDDLEVEETLLEVVNSLF